MKIRFFINQVYDWKVLIKLTLSTIRILLGATTTSKQIPISGGIKCMMLSVVLLINELHLYKTSVQ